MFKFCGFCGYYKSQNFIHQSQSYEMITKYLQDLFYNILATSYIKNSIPMAHSWLLLTKVHNYVMSFYDHFVIIFDC